MLTTLTPHNLFWVLGEQSLGPLEFYFAEALRKNNNNVSYINIHDIYPKWWRKLNGYTHRFPRRYDNAIREKYFKIISDALITQYKKHKPSHIFIYNDCKIIPETLEFFKRNGTKIIIFLGDDPNYLLPGKKTFLLSVMKADAVIVPDTGWIDGLRMLDIKNIIFSPVGTNTDVFFQLKPDEKQMSKYHCDIIFVGTGYYLNSWGIKRASLLNAISEFDFKLFGDRQWEELLVLYPDLRKNYIFGQLSADEINIACNCAKIYPVVVNSGVVNGVSTRIFDCIASGIFVIAEYKKDLDLLFPENEVEHFKSIRELKDKTGYFLKNEREMKDRTNKARKRVLEKYTLENLVKNILEQI